MKTTTTMKKPVVAVKEEEGAMAVEMFYKPSSLLARRKKTTTTTTATTSPVATTATASGKTKTTKYSALTPEKRRQYAEAARKKKELRLQNMTPEERVADKQKEREQKRSSYYKTSYYKRKYTKAMEHLQRGLVEQNFNVEFGGPTLSASIFGKELQRINVPPMVAAVYSGIGQNLINGSHSCCYGECQPGSIQSAFVYLVQMSLVVPGSTTMVELGAGMGKPALHWGALFNSLAVGVEYDNDLFLSSLSNLKKVYKKAKEENYPLPPVRFLEATIFDIDSLNPFDVVYSFDSLFEFDLVGKVAQILNNSNCKVFLSYRNKNEWLIHGLKNFVQLGQVQMTMTVSKEKRTCYIFRLRNSSEAAIDIIFRGAIEAYNKGKHVLTGENELIDVSGYCTNMKTRSQKEE